MNKDVKEAFDKAFNKIASKMAFDGLNRRDEHIRRIYPRVRPKPLIINDTAEGMVVHPDSPRHHTACSDQNAVKELGPWLGAAECDCQRWHRPDAPITAAVIELGRKP